MVTDTPRSNETERETAMPPRSWVDALLESDDAIRCLLDEAQQAHLRGASEEARETLRGFARSEPGMFQAVALGSMESEQFYRDLTEQYPTDDAPIDDLKSFCRHYTLLTDEIQVTVSEQFQDVHNPDPRIRSRFRYSRSQHPLVAYSVHSGEVELCEFVHYPSQVLSLAVQLVETAGDLLERVERNENGFSEFECDRLARTYQHLHEQVSRTERFVDTDDTELAAESASDASDVADADGEDWTFY